MEPLWPVWEANVSFTIEADQELVAKQIISRAEEDLERLPGVHVLGATVLRRKDEPDVNTGVADSEAHLHFEGRKEKDH